MAGRKTRRLALHSTPALYYHWFYQPEIIRA
jgi:hypothetical protein